MICQGMILWRMQTWYCVKLCKKQQIVLQGIINNCCADKSLMTLWLRVHWSNFSYLGKASKINFVANEKYIVMIKVSCTLHFVLENVISQKPVNICSNQK